MSRREPIFWTTWLAAVLTGVSLSQATRWAGTSFSSDPLWIKLFIGLILGLNLAKAVCDVMGIHTVVSHHSPIRPVWQA